MQALIYLSLQRAEHDAKAVSRAAALGGDT